MGASTPAAFVLPDEAKEFRALSIAGFREGVAAGEEAALQRGFNRGFCSGSARGVL